MPLDDSQARPFVARRIGYSSRGNASPVGESQDPPLTVANPQEEERQQAERADSLERSYQTRLREEERIAREQATTAKKTANAQREADFRTKGQKFYTDSFGDLQPEVDEAGKPRFNVSTWKKAKDEATGAPVLARRNEQGKIEQRRPKVTTSGDLRDPNLYYDFGTEGKEAAGHVDDLARSKDPEIATAATKYREQRNKAIHVASLKPLNDSIAAAAVELGSAKQQKATLEAQRQKIAEQIAQLDADPAIKQKSGLIFTEPTSDARRLQGQRAALQAQADSLAQQELEIETSIKKGGKLYAKHEQATIERDLWVNESKLTGLENLAENRRALLKKQGRSEHDDPVLAQIQRQQEEFGVKASLTQQRATELQTEFERERAATAAKAAPTEAQVREQAAGIENRRRTIATAFNQLSEDAKAGRIDPTTAATARQSLIDAEREHARSVGQLAGRMDALQKGQRSEANQAKIIAAQGEQLYNLEKNAGSRLQRMVEGTRDREGTQRQLLAKNPAIKEAAKAAAFSAGDTEYSPDLFARLPGKQIAIHPAAFTIQGLKREDGSTVTWRDAIDQAVKAGALDPKRAEPMRTDLARKEMVTHEAAVDATLENDVFRRWLHNAHPELTSSNILGWHSYDFNVPAGNPQLRAAAKEFLKAEPSSAQKIWNGLKMVGVGALSMGVEGVRAVMPEDGSGDRALKEFSDRLQTAGVDPRLNDHWMSLIGQGLGSSLAFALPAGAAGGLVRGLGVAEKVLPKMSLTVEKWTVSGVIAAEGAVVQGQQMYEEARQAGASKDVADGARWLGYVLGASEAVGAIGDMVRRAGSAKAFSLGSAIRTAVAEMTEETIQEVGQQAGNNAVARMLYDQNRDLFEGFEEGAIGASGSSAIMSVLASVAGGIRYRRTTGLLNAAQQSREQSDAALETVFARPEVEAVKDILPPASAITQHFAQQRAKWQEAIAKEAAKKNPSEDQMLFLHEQLAQLEIQAGSASRQIAAHALNVAQAAAQADAAPDFIQTNPELGAQFDPVTNQPLANPATIGANRNAVRALVKIGAGVPVANLTEGETQGLQTIGAQLGSEMVRDMAGRPVVTDKARDWALELAPATATLLPQSEGEITQAISAATAASTTTPQPKGKAHGQNEAQGRQRLPLDTNVAPAGESSRSPAEGASASVSFTNAAGKTERVVIPTGAVVPSTKAPVRDQASAEQYLAETQSGPVRDVEYVSTQPGKAASGQKKPTADKDRGTVKPGAILPHLVRRMRAKGADDRTIASTAATLAKQVNDTVGRYRGLFAGRIEVADTPTRTGGFSYNSERDALVISPRDLGADADAISQNPERVGQLIREEAIHRAAVRLEKRGDWKAADLWQTITPATREAFVRAYNQGRAESEGAKTTDPWAMGHEMVRMLVQGRLAVQDGRLTIDGAAISEETASPGLITKIADILRKIRDYFTDLAAAMKKDGNAPEAIAEVSRVVDLVTRKIQALERITTPTTSTPAAENTAETVEGEKLKGEWVKFAPESGTLGVPRTEMPQFKNEHLGALTQFLTARGITHTTEEVLPGSLKPSQEEYSEAKVAKVRKAMESGAFGPRSILVSSDGYILDRHHQFVAALTADPRTPIPIIRFSAPIQELFDVVHDFPSVEYSTGAKGRSTAGQTETAKQPTSPEPAGTAPTEITPEAEGATGTPAPPSEKAQTAAALGIDPAQVGQTEQVTHKGKTVTVVNVVIEAEQAVTSHNPDGSIRAGYPQALQPRDRSGNIYLDQQRRIAANPNLAEERLAGTPDRGTPIMAMVDGRPVVVVGNGRANAKALMYQSADLAEVAGRFRAEIAQVAAEKGIDPAAVAALSRPTLVRFIVEPMATEALRAFSQESNEFSGAATNAIEQAKVDASRLKPSVLAFFDPAFDLDSAKNADFRREFVRQVIGRAENITGPDLRRRVQAALFAKAFGDTEAGMAAFSRLAGEDDEGTRNLVRAMLDVAPAFAAMRQQIEAGNLHPLDLAPALTRAVQAIAVTLREKPAAQPVDVALDGLVNQGDLAIDGQRDLLDDALLGFLVENRRNRANLTAGLNDYIAGVYAAGDPKQADMFGNEPPTALEVFQSVGTALASGPATAPRITADNAATPVRFEVTRQETGQRMQVEMPAGKAAKLLNGHIKTLERIARCLEGGKAA